MKSEKPVDDRKFVSRKFVGLIVMAMLTVGIAIVGYWFDIEPELLKWPIIGLNGFYVTFCGGNAAEHITAMKRRVAAVLAPKQKEDEACEKSGNGSSSVLP
jgi:hypothetical protein